MILPGISGSFILVLIGAYQPVMGAIKGLSEGISSKSWDLMIEPLTIIAVVGTGCLVGLFSFSRLLSWLFKNYVNVTLAVLTGFMFGSLNKIWPWKHAISTRINSKGEEVPVQFSNMLPNEYADFFQVDHQLLSAITLAVIGFLAVFALEFIGNKVKSSNDK